MIDGATYRRILADALTAQAERYRARGRSLMDVHARKPGNGFMAEAQEMFALAIKAEEIRDAVENEGG